MASEDLKKKLKKKKKTTNKNKEDHAEFKSSELFQIDETPSKVKGEKRKKKSFKQANQSNILAGESENTLGGKKKSKLLRHNLRKNDNVGETESSKVDKLDHEPEVGIGEEDGDIKEVEDRKKRKSKKKKRRHEKKVGFEKINDGNLEASHLEAQVEGSETLEEASIGKNIRTRKAKKARKTENVEHLLSKDEQDLLKKIKEADEDEIYQISSGDEDSSKGMRKWIMEYHQSRPGLTILQERIDDFITAHEAQQEQARKEREAQAAEGGWTVVVHHKGRKKTTDSESGIAVGSVAQAAVLDKMAKKKSTEVGLDFYRFQKREAHRNEVMMLQSKFEQDKKRIQQLRAQRKFRPY